MAVKMILKESKRIGAHRVVVRIEYQSNGKRVLKEVDSGVRVSSVRDFDTQGWRVNKTPNWINESARLNAEKRIEEMRKVVQEYYTPLRANHISLDDFIRMLKNEGAADDALVYWQNKKEEYCIKYEEKSWEQKRDIMRLYFNYIGKPYTSINDITNENLKGYYLHLQKKVNANPPEMSISTCSTYMRQIRAFMNKLKEDNKLPYNVNIPKNSAPATVQAASQKAAPRADHIIAVLERVKTKKQLEATGIWLLQFVMCGINLKNLFTLTENDIIDKDGYSVGFDELIDKLRANANKFEEFDRYYVRFTRTKTKSKGVTACTVNISHTKAVNLIIMMNQLLGNESSPYMLRAMPEQGMDTTDFWDGSRWNKALSQLRRNLDLRFKNIKQNFHPVASKYTRHAFAGAASVVEMREEHRHMLMGHKDRSVDANYINRDDMMLLIDAKHIEALNNYQWLSMLAEWRKAYERVTGLMPEF